MLQFVYNIFLFGNPNLKSILRYLISNGNPRFFITDDCIKYMMMKRVGRCLGTRKSNKCSSEQTLLLIQRMFINYLLIQFLEMISLFKRNILIGRPQFVFFAQSCANTINTELPL